jgi:hypothetical protein
MDQALWLVRITLLQAGSVLAARGIGDETLWQAVTGAIISSGAAFWSWRARQAALAAEPPR